MIRSFRAWAPLGLLILLQCVFVYVYLAHEDTFHFWDYAMYANMAIGWHSAPTFAQTIDLLISSFAQKYNLLFAFPSHFAFSLFGASRDVFIVTNALVYFVPFQLAIGAVLKAIYRQSWPFTLSVSLLLGFLIPFAWYPLLQGYPDHGAAASLMMAVAFAMKKNQTWKSSLAVGLFLGLSIVWRRHYAYPALALLVTMGLFDAFLWVRYSREHFRKWAKAQFRRFVLAGIGLFGILFALEPFYLMEILSTDYTSLYKSYEQPPLYFVLFAFSRIGIVLLVVVLAGYGISGYLYPQNRKRQGFIGLLFMVWLVLWSAGPSQAGEHYLLSIMPLFCVVGLFGPIACLPQHKNLWPVVASCFALLLAGSAYALWFAPFVIPTDRPVFSLLATPRPPWVRGDKDELIKLAQHIKHTTTDTDKIVVVGSSFILNQDLIRALYTDELRDISPALRFLQAPESDGEQDPPLDVFSAGTVFIVPDPAQYHLPIEGQRVITGLATRFPPTWQTAPLFEKDNKIFVLDKGVVVSVWRRKAWPPEILHQQLQEIRKYKNTPREWVLASTQGLAAFNHAYFLNILVHKDGAKTSSLFLDRPLSLKAGRVAAKYETSAACEKVDIRARLSTGDGKPVHIQSSSFVQPAGWIYVPLGGDKASGEETYLYLDVTTFSHTECTVAFEQLDIEQTNNRGLPER